MFTDGKYKGLRDMKKAGGNTYLQVMASYQNTDCYKPISQSMVQNPPSKQKQFKDNSKNPLYVSREKLNL